MSRLLETIHINNGHIHNLSYHNERLNLSRIALYSNANKIDLADYILLSDTFKTKRIKCRVLYSTVIERIEYFEYHPKMIGSLKILNDDDISYNYKYEDRSALSRLYTQRGECDDILIVKNGLFTDTYYCNIALLKDGIWITPRTPLLEGTQRSFLLDKGKIFPKDIGIKTLAEYESIRLFNSILGFGEIELPISSIKEG